MKKCNSENYLYWFIVNAMLLLKLKIVMPENKLYNFTKLFYCQ